LKQKKTDKKWLFLYIISGTIITSEIQTFCFHEVDDILELGDCMKKKEDEKGLPDQLIHEVPQSEIGEFDALIKEYRKQHIRSSDELVRLIFSKNKSYINQVRNRNVSKCIKDLREEVWREYLTDEVNFNAFLMRDLHNLLQTPKSILNSILFENITTKKGDALLNAVRSSCGEYAGRVFPYIYHLSLSNTQSRRSRAGKTFEAIIYNIYDILGYEYDSQSKVGKKVFDEQGLGKKVDSVLPSIKAYEKKRSKTIIGTMKTTLRERWQEVAEEISRTNIPEIHLLTVDEDISKSKATEMQNHNITIVAYKWIADSTALKQMKNIISFEDYLFDEIPSKIEFWNNDKK
jgi:hypothetical protein